MKSVKNGCIRLHIFNFINRIRECTATGSAEGDHGFPTEVILVKKAVHYHRHTIPPVWEANKNRIVLIQIFDMRSQLLMNAIVLFSLSSINGIIVVIGIRFYCSDRKQLSAGSFCNHTGHHTRIACDFTVKDLNTG